jgi:hypothetical protein
MEVGQFTSEYQTLIYPPPLRTLEFFLAWFDLQLLCYLLSWSAHCEYVWYLDWFWGCIIHVFNTGPFCTG